jgi:Universal stress protein family
MKKTIVLAVDTSTHVSAAAQMTRELCRDSGDNVIVLHVHEFATGRWGRMQVDCHDGAGERIVGEIVADLQAAGIKADGEIREARFGHIARNILDAADEHDARINGPRLQRAHGYTTSSVRQRLAPAAAHSQPPGADRAPAVGPSKDVARCHRCHGRCGKHGGERRNGCRRLMPAGSDERPGRRRRRDDRRRG